MIRNICRHAGIQILIISFIMLSWNSGNSGCCFTESRISEFFTIQDVGYVVHRRRRDKEGPDGGSSYPAPKANPNDHVHH
ncbi:hypothetical protein ACP275_08G210200 [Erythranthe tilingii]